MLTRRSVVRLPGALAGAIASLGAGDRAAKAAVCAPRGGGCSLFRPCCDGSRCRVFASNPFAGLCPGRGAVALLRRHGGLHSSARAHALLRGDVTCDDFATRREARRFLRRNPGFDASRLDEDDDGRICRDLPRR